VSGVSSKNVLVLLMYILMRQQNATDWGTGKQPGLDEIEPSNIQLHHICPFDYMTKNKAALKQYLDRGLTPSAFRSDINDIANLTFLSQARNSSIRENPPSSYLKSDTTKVVRRAHFIPENETLWKTENFSKFLVERRLLLAQGMTRLLKQL
jgi:hypothetical protein